MYPKLEGLCRLDHLTLMQSSPVIIRRCHGLSLLLLLLLQLQLLLLLSMGLGLLLNRSTHRKVQRWGRTLLVLVLHLHRRHLDALVRGDTSGDHLGRLGTVDIPAAHGAVSAGRAHALRRPRDACADAVVDAASAALVSVARAGRCGGRDDGYGGLLCWNWYDDSLLLRLIIVMNDLDLRPRTVNNRLRRVGHSQMRQRGRGRRRRRGEVLEFLQHRRCRGRRGRRGNVGVVGRPATAAAGRNHSVIRGSATVHGVKVSGISSKAGPVRLVAIGKSPQGTLRHHKILRRGRHGSLD